MVVWPKISSRVQIDKYVVELSSIQSMTNNSQVPTTTDALSKTMRWVDSNSALLGGTAVIPLIPGRKNPIVPYKDNAWTQENAWTFVKEQHGAKKKHSDYGLLLDRLYVVDADDEATVNWLESLVSETSSSNGQEHQS